MTKQEDKATNNGWKLHSMTTELKYLNKQTCWEKLFGVTRSEEMEQMETDWNVFSVSMFVLFFSKSDLLHRVTQ